MNKIQIQKQAARQHGIDTFLGAVALKQKVGRAAANQQALAILIYFDAAHRGEGFIVAENALVKLVVMAQVVGSKSGNTAFYDCACRAGVQLAKAAGRGEDLLRLTTGEYAAIRHMVASYLWILPDLELAMLVHAARRSEELILEMTGEN